MMRALVVLLLLSQTALAADKRVAAAHFREGSQLYADGRWAEALVEFEAGYEAYPLRGFLVNIGQCYRKLERLDEAADTWRRFLATRPADSKLKDEVTDALADVESAISARKPEPAPPPPPIQTAAPAPVEAAISAPALVAEAPPPLQAKKSSRRWVWAVVGVAVASAAAVAVTVGVVEWQQSSPRAGSLGLLDGRR